MAVETTQTFICDTGGCANSTEDEGGFARVSMTYRLSDGSSGVVDRQFCPTHESKVNGALHALGAG